jgi:hypothetical protein
MLRDELRSAGTGSRRYRDGVQVQSEDQGAVMKRYKIVLAMTVILGSVDARSIPPPRRSEVRFLSDGVVRTLNEVLRADITAELFNERTVRIKQINANTRFVTIDGWDRTDLEVWTLKKQIGWQVTWTDALIEHKDTFADQHPDFAGIVPELVQIGPRDFAVGVLTIRRTGYSGGGGANIYLNLYNLSKPGAILRDSLVASSKTIRACFSEADYNSGRPCSDEYNASSTLKFFGMRNGMYRLKKRFEVEMQPVLRKPSDPSGDTPQADRIAVCAPYNLEYEWNPQKLEFVSLWPEPDSCAL